jgi:hypothetical protein
LYARDHPEKVAAYVGVAQIADFAAGESERRSRVDLTQVRRFDVPVVFMLGRHDWHVPAVLAARYFDTIEAPSKRLVWFEQSAHNPPFEEPDAFVRAVVQYVLPLATAEASLQSRRACLALGGASARARTGARDA